ncbi:hypothetical protein GMORB2_7465 [Geosmithia morbida]|uniref:Uncharacterized protein n=1 Tax=Geosmithia morbida TaxID=1094350 RepID=A0A9P4YVJ5_9HYPO|nr:uncharacterized protein GMORB2_7465 [Geosmithia morbida]KAF4122473.1 hypothetical protein GMORB2_7465 [Geosmithia morbida]
MTIPSGIPRPPMASAFDKSDRDDEETAAMTTEADEEPSETSVPETTETEPSSTRTASEPETMTDSSGISSHGVVTHAPSSATRPETVEQTTAVPSATGTDGTSSGGGNARISTGTIIGASLGGAATVSLVVLAVLVLIMRTRRKSRGRGSRGSEHGGSEVTEELACVEEEKRRPPPAPPESCHGEDPFGPFGGRADGHTICRTFELDGTARGCPARMPEAAEPVTHDSIRTVQTLPDPVDSKANLHSLGYDDGRPRYVNHWNQYREMGGT